MAESSAKSGDRGAGDCRARYGDQVVLLNSRFSALQAAPEGPNLFDHGAWAIAEPVTTGRGANWFVQSDQDHFVLRHFRRGGAVAWLLGNKYWFSGEEATRSIAEFRLLKTLHDRHLPVPEPVAAGYRKRGLWYTAQLLTRRIPNAGSWSGALAESSLAHQPWSDIGRTVARVHKERVDHADLNAHNILVDTSGSVFVIDFDKSRQRRSIGGVWRQRNLARLKRSLYKILPAQHAQVDECWQRLIAAYEEEWARDGDPSHDGISDKHQADP